MKYKKRIAGVIGCKVVLETRTRAQEEHKKKKAGNLLILVVETKTALLKKGELYKMRKISAVNAHVIPAMKQHLQLKAYSISTIKTYLNEISQLLQLLNDVPADGLTTAQRTW